MVKVDNEYQMKINLKLPIKPLNRGFKSFVLLSIYSFIFFITIVVAAHFFEYILCYLSFWCNMYFILIVLDFKNLFEFLFFS